MEKFQYLAEILKTWQGNILILLDMLENFKGIGVDSFILDSEIVAVDIKRNRILPF